VVSFSRTGGVDKALPELSAVASWVLVQHFLVAGVRRLAPASLAALADGAAIYRADSMMTDQVAAGASRPGLGSRA
jgi:hypothetical protein